MAGPQDSKYSMLHARGVALDDDSLDYILENMGWGIADARLFLGNRNETGLHFFCSDNLDRIGYAPEVKGINLPVRYLNVVAALMDDAHCGIKELTATIGGSEATKRIDSETFYYIAGLEETIHHFQHVGDPALFAQYPGEKDTGYGLLSELGKVLCDAEVEARETVDKILVSKGREPIWRDYDNLLKEQYPERYRLTWKEQLRIENG